MPKSAASASETPDPAPADDAARLRAERNLAMLDELKEAALRLALSLERQVTGHQPGPEAAAREPAADPIPEPAPARSTAELALAFHRAGRAVRLSIALQDRLMAEARRAEGAAGGADAPREMIKVVFVDGPTGELRDNAGEARPWSPPSAQARATAQANRAEALGVVRRVAQACLLPGELSPRDERETVEHYCREAAEHLEDESDGEREFEEVLRRPVSEIVAHLCREIGLRPDWTVLSREAWALQELAGDRVGAPLAPYRPAEGTGAWEKPAAKPMRPPDRWPAPS